MLQIVRWNSLFGLTICFIAGCAATTETKRLAPDELSDIEYGTGLTSQDFRSIAQRMARSLVSLPQIQQSKNPPRVAFASVENNSSDYIDGDTFLRKMRTELVKHAEGRLVFLDRDVIQQIEKENRDKAAGKRTSSGEGTPYGADFFLTGTIDSIDRVTGSGRTGYTRYSFRLTNAADSAIVWEDDYEIKKHSVAGAMYR
ncbi:MAG TPA: hypothetical protein PLL20_21095 [Phycisphaerae bacterium]|nr:hypothetical protein [Phycisphaerae bacterium]